MEDTMLNKQQRHFRKVIAEREKEQKRNRQYDTYSYRDERFESERPISYKVKHNKDETPRKLHKKPMLQIGAVIGLLVLLWTIPALYTWILPNDNIHILSNENPNIIGDSGLMIHTYIQRTDNTDTVINEHLNTLMNYYNQNVLTTLKIDAAFQKLLVLQAQTATIDTRLQPLKNYYDQQFKLVHQILNNLKLQQSQAGHNELSRLTTQLNRNTSERQLKMIMIFQTENISYTLQHDGSINYEYTK